MGNAHRHQRLLCDVLMTRKLLTVIAAALTIWGGIFYTYVHAWDDDLEVDW